MAPRRSRRTGPAIALAAAALLPPALTGLLAWRSCVDVPYYDQWEFVDVLEQGTHGALSLATLLGQHNENRPLFPRLIQLALAHLTGWDTRCELVVVLLLAGLLAGEIVWLGRRTVRVGPAGRAALALLTTALVFSPAAWETWLMGDLMGFLIPLDALVLALVLLEGSGHLGGRVLLTAGLGVVSTFSSSGGLLFWPVIGVAVGRRLRQATPRRVRWVMCPWLGVAGTCLLLYFRGYRQPFGTPPLSSILEGPARAAAYWLAFLGAPLTPGLARPETAAMAVGCLLVVILAALAWALLTSRDAERRERSVCWLLLASYPLAAAAVASVGRGGFGVAQALASRYTSLAVVLIIALAYAVPLATEEVAQRLPAAAAPLRALLSVLAVALVTLQVLTHRVGAASMQRERVRRLQGKAGIVWMNVVEEDQLLLEVCPPREDYRPQLRHRVNVLDGLGFLRPPLRAEGHLAREDVAARGYGARFGRFERLARPGDGTVTAVGWSVLPHRGESADAVVLAYERGDGSLEVVALADTEVERPEVGSLRAGWVKAIPLAALPPGRVTLHALAFDAERGRLFPIRGAHVVER